MEHSGLIALLRDDKYDDLARMYHVFKRVDGGLALIRNVMSENIKETGRQMVQVRGMLGVEPCRRETTVHLPCCPRPQTTRRTSAACRLSWK